MKKVYETPVVEKLDFDYTKVVAASDGPTQYKTTMDHKCVVIIEEKPTYEEKPTEGIVVKCQN